LSALSALRPAITVLLRISLRSAFFVSFSFTATAPTALYTLSLHDALPISARAARPGRSADAETARRRRHSGRESHAPAQGEAWRSEEHTSELQSRGHLVCRLLLEKKKKKKKKQKKFTHQLTDTCQ